MTQPEHPLDHLSTEDLLEIAAGVVENVQVRDLGLLASAAARPRTTVFGDDAYPTLADKAAALMHSLARNHPLVDGNKRLAWSATRVFCLLNGTDLIMDVDDAEQMVLAVAAGHIDAAELTEVIERHLG
ncbi:type II toxin-antitoxin system death-on-curing family toxin [Kineococcus gynurae]|uniref:Type II toxin-antitoxin system death-on-curing family toxin n=1 Tax=Kineococcus gynurae TaxID=452979 RepID=A0ABV5LSE7_9ACTN